MRDTIIRKQIEPIVGVLISLKIVACSIPTDLNPIENIWAIIKWRISKEGQKEDQLNINLCLKEFICYLALI